MYFKFTCPILFTILCSHVFHIFNYLLLFFLFFLKTLITGKNEHLRKTILDNKVKEIRKEDYRYFIFPMNSTGGLEGKDPFHWTVLVCDNHRKVWSYYNSLRPRKTTDPFLKDVAVVVSCSQCMDQSTHKQFFFYTFRLFLICNLLQKNSLKALVTRPRTCQDLT